mgnify:CR=1 FL=1
MPSRRKGDNEKSQKALNAMEEMCASGDPQSAYEGASFAPSFSRSFSLMLTPSVTSEWQPCKCIAQGRIDIFTKGTKEPRVSTKLL